MVTGIENVIDFTTNLTKSGEFNFEVKISGKFLKIFPANLLNKTKLIDHLKQNNAQFYIVPDREIPLKVLIRGLPTSTKIEEIQNNLTLKGFNVIKVT